MGSDELEERRTIIEQYLLHHSRYAGIGATRFGDFAVETSGPTIVITWREGPSEEDVATTLAQIVPDGITVELHNLEPWSCGQYHTDADEAAQHGLERGLPACTPGAWRTCMACHGSGEMAEISGISCLACDGSGVVDVADVQARTTWQSAWRVWAGRNYRADQSTDQ